MAIYSAVPPPSQQQSGTAAASGVDISTTAVGTGVTLSIPLDASREELPKPALSHKLLRRDSQKRREALLKGKEGSRRRQRWENGTLNPTLHEMHPQQ
jgi:hypothetical protein